MYTPSVCCPFPFPPLSSLFAALLLVLILPLKLCRLNSIVGVLCTLQVSGERVAGLVRGWHMGSILRLSQSSLVLEQPATATWEFTPELAA